MRYVAPTLLTVALLAIPSQGRADEANPPAPPAAAAPAAPQARLAAVFAQSGQALMFDSIQGEYVLVRVGGTFQGFSVTAINPRQIVLKSGTQNYVLPLAPTAPAAAHAAPATDLKSLEASLQKPAPKAPSTVKVQPLPRPGDSPIDPYAAPKPSELENPYPAPVVAKKPASPTPKVATLPATVVLPKGERVTKTELMQLRRTELDRAFSDFGARSKEISLRLETGKIHVKDVSTGSFFHRVGLRPGDVILSIAGRKITSLEVAAEVYAHLMTTDRVEMVVDRGNQRVTYRYRLVTK